MKPVEVNSQGWPMGVPSSHLLHEDATNRALRSAIQGIVATFVIGAVSAILAAIDPGVSLFDMTTLQAIGTSALTGGVISVLSYVMRRWGDASAIPTPLPPAPAASPAAPGFLDERPEKEESE